MQVRGRENRSKGRVQCNTAPQEIAFQPENNISEELLVAILDDDVKRVEDAISPVELRKCYSVLCISSKKGSLNVVKSLANTFPELCLWMDNVGRIPLHIAIMEGKAEVVRELVRACPKSLDYVTQRGETVIHFALNSNDRSCLNFLRQEIHRLDKCYLLKDPTNGTSKASFEIDTSRNSVQDVRIAVPSNPWRMRDRGLPNEGKEAGDMSASNNLQSRLSNEPMNTSPTQSSMLLSGMVFTAGATYTGLYNFRNIFPLDKNPNHLRTFSSRDIFFSPRSLPEGFWFLTATTFTFVSSMIAILVAICSAGSRWAFGVRAVSLFVLTVLFISYVMMVERLVPRFEVITGSGNILSGFELLCLYTLLVALLFLVVVLMARFLWTFIASSKLVQ